MLVALCAAAAVTAASAQTGLSADSAGLGLKPRESLTVPAAPHYGGEAVHAWRYRQSQEIALYGGTREHSQPGLRAPEQYRGVAYALAGGWGSSLEASQSQEILPGPRRYSLAGQLHAPLTEGRSISVGVRYRLYDADPARFGALEESGLPGGYTLAPARQPIPGLAPQYQVQMSYQHSASSRFGLALGREADGLSPLYDPSLSGPRQFTFTGQHWLNPAWALSYDVMSQDATTPLRSMGLRLGVHYRF